MNFKYNSQSCTSEDERVFLVLLINNINWQLIKHFKCVFNSIQAYTNYIQQCSTYSRWMQALAAASTEAAYPVDVCRTRGNATILWTTITVKNKHHQEICALKIFLCICYDFSSFATVNRNYFTLYEQWAGSHACPLLSCFWSETL